LRLLAVAPSAFPPLIAILAWIALVPGSRGLGAIVAVHALVNAGLVAVVIERVAIAKIGGMAELALVEGASRSAFWLRGALRLLAPDMAAVGLFVFAACFASFAIPLALGGARAATLELAVFARLRAAGDLRGAVEAATVQTFFILGMAWLLGSLFGSPRPLTAGRRALRLDLLAWAPGVVVLAVPGALLFAALAKGVAAGLGPFLANSALRAELPRLFAGSFAASVGAGLACAFAWLALAFARPRGAARRALVGYAAPSATLTGFALWLLLPAGDGWALAKIALGSALLVAPALYRLEWDSRLESLRAQFRAAEALGASDALIFARVALPQLWRPACVLAGLAAFWTWGDFALSAIVADRHVSIGMASSALLDAYRVDQAMVAAALALAGGAATFLLFLGAGYVDRA
jgi:thiamine transport system permease protein